MSARHSSYVDPYNFCHEANSCVFPRAEQRACRLNLLSDDLTEIALSVEKRLGVRRDRREYPKIHNVSGYARALHESIWGQRAPARRRKAT